MEYMNIKEVADYLRLHQNTVYRLCKNGEIPHQRIGTTIRVHKEDLASYLKAK